MELLLVTASSLIVGIAVMISRVKITVNVTYDLGRKGKGR